MADEYPVPATVHTSRPGECRPACSCADGRAEHRRPSGHATAQRVDTGPDRAADAGAATARSAAARHRVDPCGAAGRRPADASLGFHQASPSHDRPAATAAGQCHNGAAFGGSAGATHIDFAGSGYTSCAGTWRDSAPVRCSAVTCAGGARLGTAAVAKSGAFGLRTGSSTYGACARSHSRRHHATRGRYRSSGSSGTDRKSGNRFRTGGVDEPHQSADIADGKLGS